MNSVFSTVGAGSSPTVAREPVYSGTSAATAPSSPLTPSVNSGFSTFTASSPAVANWPVYSRTSSVTAPSSPFTPPINSETSFVAASFPFTP